MTNVYDHESHMDANVRVYRLVGSISESHAKGFARF